MNFITNYMNDAEKRHMLNDLTRRTFCFDFEDWVTGGFCEGTYIPYSFEENGRIVSNASANIMDFVQNGKRRKYIQIGTVMTDEAYRRRGLAGKLVRKILDDNLDSCDGVYLFANLDALDFYRALGLSEGAQYQYTLKKGVVNSSERGLFQPAVEGLKKNTAAQSVPAQSIRRLSRSTSSVYRCSIPPIWRTFIIPTSWTASRYGRCAEKRCI